MEPKQSSSARARLRAAGPALLLMLLSFTLTVDLRAQRVASREASPRRAELVRVVEQRQQRTSALEKTLATLQQELDAQLRSGRSADLRALAALIDEIGRTAGTSAARGSGARITVSDADGSGANEPDGRIQDVDLQAIVNELWNDGAEAISIGGQRVVATTAIRGAGNAILVNFHVLSSPYLITAIGAPVLAKAFADSPTARRFRSWSEIYGLGFAIAPQRSATVPAFGNPIHFRYAHATR